MQITYTDQVSLKNSHYKHNCQPFQQTNNNLLDLILLFLWSSGPLFLLLIHPGYPCCNSIYLAYCIVLYKCTNVRNIYLCYENKDILEYHKLAILPTVATIQASTSHVYFSRQICFVAYSHFSMDN